jgi:hypothetical protein
MRFPDSYIFNGLLPLKMPALPCGGLVSALSGRKLPEHPTDLASSNHSDLVHDASAWQDRAGKDVYPETLL